MNYQEYTEQELRYIVQVADKYNVSPREAVIRLVKETVAKRAGRGATENVVGSIRPGFQLVRAEGGQPVAEFQGALV